ncbi:MAG: glycosyltransferase family 4 protein [Anaerolineae bacterium]|nr:glycosyltransferase family 4 protein [Anaerolineae bacterium]
MSENVSQGKKRIGVLVISHDVVGAQMAGPGIRYYHLARVLARQFLAQQIRVALAVPGNCTLDPVQDFSILEYQHPQDPALEQAIKQAQVVIVPAVWLDRAPALLRSPAALVVDGYDPFLAETLFLDKTQVAHLQRVLAQAYIAGDFFVCASERQRDWWLGLLEAHGRINAHTFEDDVSLRRLVDVVPFGMPEGRPAARRPVFREVWPGIGARDKVILWGGGLWTWLDPLTAIRAVAQVWRKRDDVRLIFPGTRHPNPEMAQTPTWLDQARELAQSLGLVDRAVFFGDWVPYADWAGALLESDVALSLHYDTLETRLAFRTRVLDYIWAGLPMVITRGDETAQLVQDRQLGMVVDYEDVDGVATAILKLLDGRGQAGDGRFEQVRQGLTWEKAALPLIAFCRDPRRAPDKAALDPGRRGSISVAEVEHLRDLVAGYERGRFIRFTKWLRQTKQRLLGRRMRRP